MTIRFRELTRDSTLLVLGAIVLAAAVLRVWGVTFGLPFLYHGDEAMVVDHALRMPVDGPNPHWFQYPTLYIYVQAAIALAVFAVERVAGAVGSYADFLAAYGRDPSTVYTAARLATALLGTAAVAATGLAGRAFREAPGAGLAAAALLAVDLLHVEHSHFATTDVPLSLVAALLALRMSTVAASASGGTVRQYAGAGLLVGVAASLKYPGALLGLLVAAVYAQQADWRRLGRDARLPTAAVAAVTAFVAGSPFALLSPGELARDLAVEAAHMRVGHLGFEAARNGWSAQAVGLYEAGDVVLMAFFAIGTCLAFVRREPFARALAVTVLGLFAVAGASSVLFTRYLLPLLPLASLVAAYGMSSLARAARPRSAPIALATLALVSCALPAYATWHRLRLFGAQDTRTLAWRWVDANLAAEQGERIALEWDSIPARSFARVDSVPLRYDLAALQASGVRYVAVSDRLYGRFLKHPDRYPAQAAFYADLRARGTLLWSVSPFAGNADGAPLAGRPARGPAWRTLPARTRAGPRIDVFEVPVTAHGGEVGPAETPDEESDDGLE